MQPTGCGGPGGPRRRMWRGCGGTCFYEWSWEVGREERLTLAGATLTSCVWGLATVRVCSRAWARVSLVYCAVRVCINMCPLPAFTNDLYSFDPASSMWTELSTTGARPAPRQLADLTATPDGRLYVFGGMNSLAATGGTETREGRGGVL